MTFDLSKMIANSGVISGKCGDCQHWRRRQGMNGECVNPDKLGRTVLRKLAAVKLDDEPDAAEMRRRCEAVPPMLPTKYHDGCTNYRDVAEPALPDCLIVDSTVMPDRPGVWLMSHPWMGMNLVVIANCDCGNPECPDRLAILGQAYDDEGKARAFDFRAASGKFSEFVVASACWRFGREPLPLSWH